MDPATLVALIIVALTAIFFFVRSGGGGNDAESIAAGTTRQKVDGVVLVGCSGSGKTTIFHKICSGTVPVTVPSMAPAYQGASLPSGKSIQVVDFPGHERLRQSMLSHVKTARGVVIIVDPTSAKAIKMAAQLLFNLLASSELSASTPLMVFCNKGDAAEAKSSDRVKMLAAREIDAMRKTSGTISEAGTEDDRGITALGVEGRPFSFDSEDEGRAVTFASGSATSTDKAGGLCALVDFLESRA